MIDLTDIPLLSGFVFASFFTGYAASYLLYVVRRGLWLSSR
jgi:hypothetical protein